jgi:hypothetical protein
MVDMAPEANTGTDAADAADDVARLAELATALADGIERALPLWVVRQVENRLASWSGAGSGSVSDAADPAIADRARAAGRQAQVEIGSRVRRVLSADIDEQRVNPLAVVRGAVRYPTEVLRAAGVPPVERDAQAERQFPDDDYDLTPGAFADLDPALREPGMMWGAAKAYVHLRRRRAEGRL